jgi:MFS transporter, Spinster family, sphingosine-1-phosphate transporter
MANATVTVAHGGADNALPPRHLAWTAFAVLLALMIVNYVDRQVVVSMFPHLKREWTLSDRELGALVSIVSVVVALGAVPLALLADRFSRVVSIVLMALVWSLATLACSFTQDYSQLLVARAFVGLGEAAYGSAGTALIASIFPSRLRSTVLGAFLGAGLVGSVLGVVLGGVVAQHWGWRASFSVVAIPGLVLAMLTWLFIRDQGAVTMPRTSLRAKQAPLVQVVRELLGPRTVIYTCLGAGLQLLVVSTIWAWTPSFFNRYYGLAPDQAALKTGLVVLLGCVGSVAWSVVADRLARRNRRARLYVPVAAGLLTTTFMCLAFGVAPPGPVQFALILAGATVMTGTIGAVAAVVLDVVNPALHATAAAVLSLTQNLIGLAAGPFLTGALSDAYGLPFALSVVPLCCLLAAGLFVVAARTYEADVKHVAHDRDHSMSLHPRLGEQLT